MRSLPEVLNAFGQRLFVAAAERRHAKQTQCPPIFELYRHDRCERVRSNSRALYQRIVAQCLGAEASRAGEFVRRAEQSFTGWQSTAS
jgi:hypothetical protein